MSGLQPIGYNIAFQFLNGLYNEVIEELSIIRPKTTLWMDAGGVECAATYEAINHPDAVVIHRSMAWGNDMNFWKNKSPGWILDRVREDRSRMRIPSEVYINVSNEPNAGHRAEDHERMADWHAAVLDKCCNAGERISIFHLGSGVVPPEVVAAGAYDHFLERYVYWHARGLARLGIHEYTAGDIPLSVGAKGVSKPQEELIMDFSVGPDRWLRRPDIRDEGRMSTVLGRYPDFWHMGRLTWWFALRAVEIGLIDNPDDLRGIDITEGAIDRMGDLGKHERRFEVDGFYAHVYDHAETVSQPLTDGHRNYVEHRGANTWLPFFQQKYGQYGWSSGQALYQMHRWLFEELYHDGVESMTLFQVSFHGAFEDYPEPLEWGGVGYNVWWLDGFRALLREDAPILYKDVEDDDGDTKPVPPIEPGIPAPLPDDQWVKVEITGFIPDWTSMNVRPAPGVGNEPVAVVSVGSVVWVEPSNGARVENGDYTWMRVRLSKNGNIRWMATEAQYQVYVTPEPGISLENLQALVTDARVIAGTVTDAGIKIEAELDALQDMIDETET